MAYMSQEKKKEIRNELKKVIPSDWKWSLAVKHSSTLVLTIAKAPFNYFETAISNCRLRIFNSNLGEETSLKLNTYYLENYFVGADLELFKNIKDAMNKGNHDNSQPQYDHFDVGWYIDIQLGSYEKPFVVE